MGNNIAGKELLDSTSLDRVRFPYPESFLKSWEWVLHFHSKREAIRWKNHSITYEALGSLVNHVRFFLAEQLAPHPHQIIGLSGDHVIHLIAAQIAVLCEEHVFAYLGGSVESTLFKQPNFQCRSIIDCSINPNGLQKHWQAKCPVVSFEFLPTESHRAIEVPNETASSPGSLFMTSGSGGQSLAVLFPLHGLMQDIHRQTHSLRLSHADRFDLLFSMSFSASLAPIFGALLNGSLLCVYDWKNSEREDLVDWLNQQQISISTMTPSMLRSAIHSTAIKGSLPNLRLLSLGGESIRSVDIERMKPRLSQRCVIQIAYASTETRTIAEWLLPAKTLFPKSLMSVGWPVEGKEIWICQQNHMTRNPGIQGEIVVKSNFIATHYHGDDTQDILSICHENGKTSFRTGDCGYLDDDGKLVLVGRLDDLVKVRGVKVSLKAVEREATAILPNVDLKAIMLADHLVLCVESEECDGANIQKKLLRMPKPLRPHQVRVLSAFPKTHTGKVDPPALKSLLSSTLETQRPQCDLPLDLEKSIYRLFELVLKCSAIDGESHFIDEMGMDSLQSIELHARLECLMNVVLPRTLFLENNHLNAVIRFLKSTPLKARSAIQWLRKPLQDPSPEAIILEITRDQFVESMLPSLDQETWGIQMGYGGVHYSFLPVSEQNNYDSIKEIGNRFATAIERQIPNVPIYLIGYSLAGVIAFETACALQRRGFNAPETFLIGTHTYKYKPRWQILREDFRRLSQRLTMLRDDLNPRGLKAFSKKFAARYGIRPYEPNIRCPRRDHFEIPLSLQLDAAIGHALKGYTPSTLNGNLVVFSEGRMQEELPSNFVKDFEWTPYVHGRFQHSVIDETRHTELIRSKREEMSKMIRSRIQIIENGGSDVNPNCLARVDEVF